MDGVGAWARVRHPDGHQHTGAFEHDRHWTTKVWYAKADPVTIMVERAGVQQLILWIELPAAAILRPQILIREGRLGIVVPPPVPRMAGHRVQVPPVLL